MRQDVRVFIVRTTNACNLACSYCYMPDKGEMRMPAELAARLIDAAATLPADSQVFVWHGGEPLLMGRAFFETVVERQRLHGLDCVNAIQTNGYGLSDAMVDFFAERDFRLAVSLDIPAARHDACRRSKAGRPTFEQVAAGLDRLRRRGLAVAALAVVADLDTPPQDHVAFVERYGLDSLALNLEFDLALGRDAAAGARYGALLSALYRHACDSPRPFAQREAGAAIEHLLGRPASLCWHSETFCGADHAAITETGDVYLGCDKFIDSPFAFARLGNFLETPLAELLEGPATRALNARLEPMRRACAAGCAIGAACRGGCIHEALSVAARGEARGDQIGCIARRSLFDAIAADFTPKGSA
jgi:uncharacterized protein